MQRVEIVDEGGPLCSSHIEWVLEGEDHEQHPSDWDDAYGYDEEGYTTLVVDFPLPHHKVDEQARRDV